MTSRPEPHLDRTARVYRVWARSRLYGTITSAAMLGVDRRARDLAVKECAVGPGDQIVEVACGTGPNLGLLSRTVGEDGLVVGVDLSPDMLGIARRRTASLTNVRLVCDDWLRADIPLPLDAAICCLGLTVIPGWEAALGRMAEVVRPGGRIVVMDWLTDRRHTWLLNAYMRGCSFLAAADPTRPILTAMTDLFDEARAHRLPVGLTVIVGTVPAQAG